MAKEFKCFKCSAYLGEMEKGKIRNGSVVLCTSCWDVAKMAIDLAEMRYSGSKADSKKGCSSDDSVVDNLLNIFGMKK